MRLSLGSGVPRLLAPGVPDWLGADGTRVGWVLRDRLFLLGDGEVRVVELPDSGCEVAATPRGWVVAMPCGFVVVDPDEARVQALLLDDEADPIVTWPGADLGQFVEMPRQRMLRLADGEPFDLPEAALRSPCLRPWDRGLGACWIDEDRLFRTGPSRAAVLGRVPGADVLACGPDGAVLVRVEGGSVVAAPGRLAVPVDVEVDPRSARFGASAVLAASEEGVVRIDLRTGAVLEAWEGSLAPVGFLGEEVVLWDRVRGALVAGGRVLLGGFAGPGPSRRGAVLAGPGGAVWDLTAGTRSYTGLGDGVCATDGVRVAHVDVERVRFLDGGGFEHGLLDDVESAELERGVLTITTIEGKTASFDPEGRRVARVRSRRVAAPKGVRVGEHESEVWIDGVRWPIPADDAARVGDEVWVWTEEGSLLVV